MMSWTRAAGIVLWSLVVIQIGGVRPLSAFEPPDLTEEQKGWALAASAVLTERNADRHDLLAGREMSEAYRRSTRNREDLQRTLLWIHMGGHRQRFEELGEKLMALSAEERRALEPWRRENQEGGHQLLIAEVYCTKLGARGLIGWDYSRYIALCRWGYASGYLDEDEAWSHIIRAARLLQATFVSWKELGENYLVGREFWSPAAQWHNGHLYREAVQRLLANPSSPWNRYPWKLNLDSRGPVQGESADRAPR